MTNSRLKDYLDLWVLLDREALNAHTLARAIAATFLRRGMSVTYDLPVGLTDEIATDSTRQAMWHAFLKKNELAITPLPEVVTKLRTGWWESMKALFSPQAKLYRCADLSAAVLADIETNILHMLPKFPDREECVTTERKAA